VTRRVWGKKIPKCSTTRFFFAKHIKTGENGGFPICRYWVFNSANDTLVALHTFLYPKHTGKDITDPSRNKMAKDE
jgi:hypothetical protein